MSKNDFLTKPNVSLLWEVIMDNEIMKNKPQAEISQIIDIFNVNLKKFHDSTSNNNLTDLNKNYITVMMNFINKNFSKPPPTSLSNQKKGLVTYEEIQNDRLSKFEKDFNSKQQEFTSAMALPIPPTPDFSDKKDEPLSEIEVEVKRYMAQRNYDVEQLSKTLNNNDSQQASSWLKPQETSLKTDKKPLSIMNPSMNSSINSNPIKYIKIDNETTINKNVIQNDVIDLTAKKKTISWANNLEGDGEKEDENLEQNTIDIFSKLKMIPTPNPSKKDEIGELKEEIKVLHQKLDTILQLLSKN
jgi:hypothetical protein